MFQKFFMDSTGTRIELRVLTKDKLDDVFAIQQESMHQECVAKGVGMYEAFGAPEEMLFVFKEVVKDGCSLIAIDKDKNEVVGVAFNKLYVSIAEGEEDPFAASIENNIKNKACLNLISFLSEVESKVNIFERYNASTTMEIFYVGTKEKYQGRGIGKRLIEGCIELARELMIGESIKIPVSEKMCYEDAIPEVLFGVFASNYSQRIAQKLNFEFLVETFYDSYIYDGKKMSDRIKDVHKSAVLGVLKL